MVRAKDFCVVYADTNFNSEIFGDSFMQMAVGHLVMGIFSHAQNAMAPTFSREPPNKRPNTKDYDFFSAGELWVKWPIGSIKMIQRKIAINGLIIGRPQWKRLKILESVFAGHHSKSMEAEDYSKRSRG
jgi:hypothetical protein